MKNLHDIIQKNSEMFDTKFTRLVHFHRGEVVIQSADGSYPIGQNEKGEFTTNPFDVIKAFFLSSQLSIIQAIDEWAESKKESVIDNPRCEGNGCKLSNLCWSCTKVVGHNSALSELHSFLEEAKTKLQ